MPGLMQDTLTYLYRGGRCNAVAAMAGGVLKLHPRIVVEDGAMNASKKYRGKIASVVMNYVKDMEKDLKKRWNAHKLKKIKIKCFFIRLHKDV